MEKDMKAIGFTKYLSIKNPDSLFEFTTKVPTPNSHDLLVKVEAVSVNPVDVFTRRSQRKQLASPKIMGWDAYGTVVSTGSEVSFFKPGDKVFYAGSYKRPGSDSEYQLVDERIVGHAPKNISIEESAAMPLTSLTTWESLFEQMDIDIDDKENNKSKSILIINGSGGVGSVATQLAHLANLTVIATAGNETTKQWELHHGNDHVVDYHDSIVDQVHDLGFQHVNYILELVNLDAYWSTITRLIGPNGSIVSTTGSGRNLNFSSLKSRMVRFGWEWMYEKSWYETPVMITQHEILDKIGKLLDQGVLKSTLTKTITPISAKNLRKATSMVESHHMMGKVVVKR
ncbi:zinc-binding alcohol dehydrogenase family protein [Fructilactobacillus fructivorans]|uniref:zinc-binding alcohol dehydrogenase family protein n=1 Tax=Fructilactobacillus fructivorans TaxID=1614 RepID=UPI000704F3B9|nr:zinc-binding alcohol dehydrogenase family protein [Fructilactobacillus fructivorans]KRN42380.1 NADPH quinone reductase related Zn-dependent oxidoreductase [Fructilactobacillus fructivorans]